jgi:hypothetical protein
VYAKALPVRLRALWFAASIVAYVWFLYWICYDILVWDKALIQADPANYAGLTASVVLIIVGTQLGKIGVHEKPAIPIQINLHRTQQGQRTQQIQPAKKVKTKHAVQDYEIPSGCKFYLGYLYTRRESKDIPEGCLECEHVVECLSPTARSIGYASD